MLRDHVRPPDRIGTEPRRGYAGRVGLEGVDETGSRLCTSLRVRCNVSFLPMSREQTHNHYSGVLILPSWLA